MTTIPRLIPITLPRQPNFVDLYQRRFGRLVVLWYAGAHPSHTSLWHCRCDCGMVKDITYRELVKGDTKSCGCLHREIMTKHGLSNTSEYHVWETMISRCYNSRNPIYHRYGGRGIKVCERWRFGEHGKSGSERFLSDMGKKPSRKHSLDRIQNDDGYRPGNVRWATHAEQQRNRRGRIWVLYRGQMRLMSEAVKEAGFRCFNSYFYYQRYGWTHQQAFDYALENYRPHNYPRTVAKRRVT